MYPVGSIYINVNNTNPSTFFGGTWVQIEDSFLLSAGSSYTGGTTGGAATVSYTPGGTVDSHTLTTGEIPSHAHSLNSHTHGLNGHTHSLNGHTHTIPNHTHTYWYYNAKYQAGTNGGTNGVSGQSGAAGSVSTSGWSGTTGGNSGNTGGNSGNTTGATGNTGNSGSGGGHTHGFTGTAATINILPPYLVVYVWQRTA